MYVISKLKISPHMHSSNFDKNILNISTTNKFPLFQSPQNGATLHSQNFQHREFLFMNANSLVFTSDSQHPTNYNIDVLFKPTH